MISVTYCWTVSVKTCQMTVQPVLVHVQSMYSDCMKTAADRSEPYFFVISWPARGPPGNLPRTPRGPRTTGWKPGLQQVTSQAYILKILRSSALYSQWVEFNFHFPRNVELRGVMSLDIWYIIADVRIFSKRWIVVERIKHNEVICLSFIRI